MSFLGGIAQAAHSASVAGLPWPEGDPEGLAAAAGKLGSVAHGLRGVGTKLGGATSGAANWHGQAAGAFRAAVADEQRTMTQYAEGLENAAHAVKRLGGLVKELQDQVRLMARQVLEAEAEATRKEGQATVAAASAATAAAAASASSAVGVGGLEGVAASAARNADDAASAAHAARTHATKVRQANTKKAQAACDAVKRADANTAGTVRTATSRTPLRGVPFGAPTPATNFGRVALSGLSRDQWQEIAYFRAGINRSKWDPSLGLLANDERVQAVYKYYGDLYLNNPEQFQWAGMANMVGPMFYAGWQDLYVARHIGSNSERTEYLSEMLGLPDLPDEAYKAADLANLPLNELAELGQDELAWYEKQFLTMQKDIFDDLAWQHEAFAMGGTGLMRELAGRGELEPQTLSAWEKIASGTPEGVAEGNGDLLHREQFDVIQEQYDTMRAHHGISGDTFTYASGVLAENPFPGGKSYRDFDPLRFDPEISTPPIGVPGPPGLPPLSYDPPDISLGHYTLPLPAGNLSNFEDRWTWINEDMLPAYRRYLENPDAVRATVSSDVADRADEFRRMPDFAYPGG